jgi:hypothetical protein
MEILTFSAIIKTKLINYSRTALTRINWEGGYAENPDNWIFL